MLHPLGINRAKLPRVEERLNQRLERRGSGLERKKAPVAGIDRESDDAAARC